MSHLFLLPLVVTLVLAAATCTQGAEIFPGRERLPDAEFRKRAPPAEFVLPPVERSTPQDTPSLSQPRVLVRTFRILGNTVLDPKRLEEIVKPYVGSSLTAAEIKELGRELTQVYVQEGYLTSGVVLPDQRIVNGVVTFVVIEGVLSRVDVQGTKKFKSKYVRDRVLIDPHIPLKLTTLGERLQLLHQNPLIERVNGKLLPSDRLGESVLIVTVKERSPYRLELFVDNHRSPSIGSLQAGLHAAHMNFSGRGDVIAAYYSITEGLDEVGLSYSTPITPRDAIFELSYNKSDAIVIEEPFDELDIESDVSTWRLALHYPIIRSPSRSFSANMRLDKRHSQSFLLSRPFSFDPSLEDGESNISVLRFGLEWMEKRRNQVIAVRSMFSKGLDIFDATTRDSGADGSFLTWLGQFQWARLLGANRNELIFRTDMQFAWDPLLPIEKFPVGGARSVRGYRENQLVRDNGLISSLEIRIPLFRSKFRWPSVQFAVFGDYGRSWNKDSSDPAPTPITSAGAGLRLNFSRKIHGEFYWAHAFNEIANVDGDNTLQDDGIHFSLSYHPF